MIHPTAGSRRIRSGNIYDWELCLLDMYSQRELKKPEDPDMVCFMDETGEVAIYAAHARLTANGSQAMNLKDLIQHHRLNLTTVSAHLTIGRIKR